METRSHRVRLEGIGADITDRGTAGSSYRFDEIERVEERLWTVRQPPKDFTQVDGATEPW